MTSRLPSLASIRRVRPSIQVTRKPIEVLTQDGAEVVKRSIPAYSEAQLPAGYCSRFVRLAAGDVFGENYAVSHAWDMRYANGDTFPTNSLVLREQVDRGIVTPGMALGLFNPTSKHNGKNDSKGSSRRYTHVALVLGKSLSGQPLFAHEYGPRIQVDTLSSLIEQGLDPREIISPKR